MTASHLQIRMKQNYMAMPEKIRNAIGSITKKYKDAGYECYLVGGSCRDLLLDKVPYDYDFATNCPLSISKRMFKKHITVGESHGTLIVFYSGFQFEITRYRKDIKTDGRKADIEFSTSIEEDQKRRDLRLNALAYDVIEDHVVDSQNGLQDVADRLIRFVGRAEERIREDHLRALRYGRLIASLSSLGFQYDALEMDAVIRVFDSRVLSIERISEELEKMIAVGESAREFLLFYLPRLHIFDRIFKDAELAENAIRMVIKTGSLLPLPFLYMSRNSLKEATDVFRLSRNAKRLLRLIEWAVEKDLEDPIIVKELLSKSDDIPVDALVSAIEILLKKNTRFQVNQIVDHQVPYRLTDLAVTGKDLKGMGLSGKAVGKTLDHLMRLVWEKPTLNDTDILREIVLEQISQ